ncbi:MAG: sigma-70 family RNA polymerase sigma factor [Myxococcota bacterium]
MILANPHRKRPSATALDISFQREALVHMSSLFQAARYLTRDDAAAEDLVQETLLKAHRFWHRYQEGTNCKAWLFRIQTNTFLNSTRKKSRTMTLIEDADSEAASDSLYEHSSFYGTPENQYLQGMLPEMIQGALEALPENFRLPVILADLQDFSYNEVAEIIGCPVGTVMSRLFRGRKRLQEALFAHAIEQGIIDPKKATDDDGALSLDAYRARKKAVRGASA